MSGYNKGYHGMREVSRFARNLAVASGIGQLMDDLTEATGTGKDIIMLGGGNPAHIPEIQEQFRTSVLDLARDKQAFAHAVGDYDPPEGNVIFRQAVCNLLHSEFHWEIGQENILLTNGSQTAFFALLNIFAGTFTEDIHKRILFPITPEYIGYCDQGLEPDMFTACRPRIEFLEEHQFKYHINIDDLHLDKDIGAVCVSRPTNPTGNMLTDQEIEHLSGLASSAGVPLIIDNAYGMPFPNIVFVDNVHPIWNENIIMCMSLSKLGLPSTRTGLVIAAPDIIQMLARINAVVSLAPGGLGAAIVTHMVQNGYILRLCRDVIRPYYRHKADFALNTLITELGGRVPFRIHKPEGAFFLWCWFEGMPVHSLDLYRRLKDKGVIIVPGEYFFPGLPEPWPHKHECIRVSYAQNEHIVEKGLKIIAQEVLAAYKGMQ